jgi:hypothetical protein
VIRYGQYGTKASWIVKRSMQTPFLPYFPYVITIRLTFLPYFPYHFTIFFQYFPNLFTIHLTL